MSRARILALVLIPALLIAAVVTTVVVLQMLDRREQVDEADSAGKTYSEELKSFRDDVTDKARQSDSDGAKVAAAVDAARDDLPELPDATEHGIKNSKAYRDAQKAEEEVDDDLDDLSAAGIKAKETQAFTDAANRVLARDPLDRVSGRAFRSGEPIRRAIVKPVSQQLADFQGVKAPEGMESARTQVVGALTFAIRDARRAAKSLDSGRGTRVKPGRLYPAARLSVLAASGKMRADLDAAISNFDGDEPDDETPSPSPSPSPAPTPSLPGGSESEDSKGV